MIFRRQSDFDAPELKRNERKTVKYNDFNHGKIAEHIMEEMKRR